MPKGWGIGASQKMRKNKQIQCLSKRVVKACVGIEIFC